MAPTLEGKPLAELGALIDGPKNVVFLITSKYSGEFSRISYSSEDGYKLGKDGGRIGESWLTGCDIGAEQVLVHFSTGHKVVFPRAWLSFTYLPA